ncbi:MAG: peptidase domain-containing ABC transporter [bacterium]
MENEYSVLNNLSIFALLPKDVKELVISSFVPVSYPFGHIIVKEGEPADAFYVLASGRARVVKLDANGDEISLYLLRPGDTFGEMGLLSRTEKRRMATVRASTEAVAFRLDASLFQGLITTNPEISEYFELQIRYRNLHNFFLEYTPFARLPIAALKTLLSEAREIAVNTGEVVIREGDEAGPMYIVEDGMLRVFTGEGHDRVYRAYLRKGDFFGELSMFKGISRSASVQALTPCKLLMLMRESFRMMIDNYPEFITRIEERISQYDYRHIDGIPLDFHQELLGSERQEEKEVEEAVTPEEPEEEYTGTAVSATLGPFASPEGLFVKRNKKRIRCFPYIWQGDETDCGVASLAMVCRFFGNHVGLNHLRQLAYTGAEGTSLKAICRAARELGLEARAIKASKRNLHKMPLPAIVHLKGDHWVVLYDMDRRYVNVADPAVGITRMERKEFEREWTGYAALFDYSHKGERDSEETSSVQWLWPFFRPFKGVVAKIIGVTIVIGLLQVSLPVFIQRLIDGGIVAQDQGLLSVFALSMAGIMVLMTIALALQRHLLSFASAHIDISAMDSIIKKLLDLPMAFFNSRVTVFVQQSIEGIRPLLDYVVENGADILMAVTQLVFCLVLMAYYSPAMGLAFCATIPLLFLLMRCSTRQLKLNLTVREEFFAKYFAMERDIVQGIETVKSTGSEEMLRKRALEQFRGATAPLVKAGFTLMWYDGIVSLIGLFAIALFWWIGARQVLHWKLTIGGLVAFGFLAGLATRAISTLFSGWQDAQSLVRISRRLQDIMDQAPEQGSNHSGLKPVRALDGRIRFQDVSFRFAGPESSCILNHISFDVPAGKRVCIVGRNGSGKTTLLKCIAGLLDPTGGAVFYDNVDAKTLNHRDLRRHCGLVLQENHLFEGSIAQNIALGEWEPDMDQVLWAARLSNAHAFIERLPLGYDTRVGDSGLALSASQRQRIAIARILYHRPSVILFDNATCFLDRDFENAFIENMNRFLAGRTCFFVDNRASHIRQADLVMVLEKGILVEQGTYKDLMELGGIFRQLFGMEQEMKRPGRSEKIREESENAPCGLCR